MRVKMACEKPGKMPKRGHFHHFQLGAFLFSILLLFQITLTADYQCKRHPIGLWAPTETFDPDTKIQVSVDSPRWTHFVLHFQKAEIDKYKLIFENSGTSIKISPIGATLSLPKLPESAMKYGQVTTITFRKTERGAMMGLASNADSPEEENVNRLEIVGFDFNEVDSVRIYLDSNINRRQEAVFDVCNPGSSSKDQNKGGGTGASFTCTKALSCPVHLQCPEPKAITCPVPVTCPKPALACPKPVTCPKLNLACPEQKPCPESQTVMDEHNAVHGKASSASSLGQGNVSELGILMPICSILYVLPSMFFSV